MLNNFSSKCIKRAKRCAFGTSYSIIYSNSIKVRLSLGKACTNLCHVFGFVLSTPGQGQQLLAGLLKKMVRRSTSSKGVNILSAILRPLHERLNCTCGVCTCIFEITQPCVCSSHINRSALNHYPLVHAVANPVLYYYCTSTAVGVVTKRYEGQRVTSRFRQA